MKKLEDFECEKVEIDNVYGGYVADCQTWCKVDNSGQNSYDGDDAC